MLAAALLVLVLPAAANAATRTVSQSGADVGDCTLVPCRHISYATTQAAPGDTVSVGSGTFVETRVVINKPLTLQGVGAGQTLVKQDPANPNSTQTGLIGIDSPSAGNITIDALTLEGANRQNVVDEPFLVYAEAMPAGGTLEVKNTAFLENTTLDPQLGSDYSVGLYVHGSGATVHVTGNTFKGMFQAVFLEANTGPSTIAGNDFDGLLASDNGCGSAGCGGLRMPDGVFLLADVGANTALQSVQGNKFHDFGGFPVTVNAVGAGATFGNLEVVGNTIAAKGADDVTGRPANGVHLFSLNGGAISSAKVLGNTIFLAGPGPSRAAIFAGEQTGGSTSGVVAHFNRIIGPSNHGIQNDAGPTIDATDNWWGCNTGPNTSGCTNTGGIGGAITSAPYLVLTASASPASVGLNESSTITASLTKDSAGNTPAGNVFPSGIPVAFQTDLGTVSPASATTTGPVATSVFSSPTAGTANVKTTLDNTTLTTPVTVVAPAGPGSGPPAGGPPITPTPPGPAAPTIGFTAPARNATLAVGRRTTVSLAVSAPAGPGAVSVSFNGRSVCSIAAAPYSCTFRPKAGDAGRRGTLVAVVTDSQGRAASASRGVVVGGPATLGSRTATVSGGEARVQIRCAAFGPCVGTLTLRARIRSHRRTRLVSVGSAPFSLTSGRSGFVQVPVSQFARSALARKRYFNTRATVRSAGVSSTRNLVLH